MKKMIIFSLVIFSLFACASGGGDDDENCDLNINSFTNGSNYISRSSYWYCTSNYGETTFALYDDGTGLDTYDEEFTWKETGCRKLSITYSDGLTSTITNLTGSTTSGTGGFTETYSDGTSVDCTCAIISF